MSEPTALGLIIWKRLHVVLVGQLHRGVLDGRAWSQNLLEGEVKSRLDTGAFVRSKSVEDILEDKLLHLREIEILGNGREIADGERSIWRKGNRALDRDGCRENTVCNIYKIISLAYSIGSPAITYQQGWCSHLGGSFRKLIRSSSKLSHCTSITRAEVMVLRASHQEDPWYQSSSPRWQRRGRQCHPRRIQQSPFRHRLARRTICEACRRPKFGQYRPRT